MKHLLIFTAALLAAVCMALPASTMADDYKVTEPTTLTWVAGGVGGGWYVQAGGIARMIAEAEPNLILKVIPGGGVVNPVRVSNHKDDLGWGITFVDKMAFKGLAPVYKKPRGRFDHLFHRPTVGPHCQGRGRVRSAQRR